MYYCYCVCACVCSHPPLPRSWTPQSHTCETQKTTCVSCLSFPLADTWPHLFLPCFLLHGLGREPVGHAPPGFTPPPVGGLRLQTCATAFRFWSRDQTRVIKHFYLPSYLTDRTWEASITISSKWKLAYKESAGWESVDFVTWTTLAPKSLCGFSMW